MVLYINIRIRPYLYIHTHPHIGCDHRTAGTIPFRLMSSDNTPYHPKAGQMYNKEGLVSKDEALFGLEVCMYTYVCMYLCM